MFLPSLNLILVARTSSLVYYYSSDAAFPPTIVIDYETRNDTSCYLMPIDVLPHYPYSYTIDVEIGELNGPYRFTDGVYDTVVHFGGQIEDYLNYMTLVPQMYINDTAYITLDSSRSEIIDWNQYTVRALDGISSVGERGEVYANSYGFSSISVTHNLSGNSKSFGLEVIGRECIDSSIINPAGFYTTEVFPVCGCDGITYSHPSHARNAGVTNYTFGPCNMEFDCQDAEPISTPRFVVDVNTENGTTTVSAEFLISHCCITSLVYYHSDDEASPPTIVN
jgi:hypothetical protein